MWAPCERVAGDLRRRPASVLEVAQREIDRYGTPRESLLEAHAIASEAVCAVLSGEALCRDPRSVLPFLCGVGRNKARSLLRREIARGATAAPMDVADGPDPRWVHPFEQVAREDGRRRLTTLAASECSFREKQMFLRYLDGRATGEIAMDLGIADSAVRSLRRHAVGRLSRVVEQG